MSEITACDTPYDQYRDAATPRSEEDDRGVAQDSTGADSGLDGATSSVPDGTHWADWRQWHGENGVLIGLSGYGQSGKDTAASFMVDRYGFTRLAFADPLKAVALDTDPSFRVFVGTGTRTDGTHVNNYSTRSLSDLIRDGGWEYAKRAPEVRRFLQHLGVAVREHVGEDTWVTATMRKIRPGRRYVFTDVRFPNEAQEIKARGGVIVRVHRPGIGAVNAHVSESALHGWDFDAHLYNDGDRDKLGVRVALLLEELL